MMHLVLEDFHGRARSKEFFLDVTDDVIQVLLLEIDMVIRQSEISLPFCPVSVVIS